MTTPQNNRINAVLNNQVAFLQSNANLQNAYKKWNLCWNNNNNSQKCHDALIDYKKENAKLDDINVDLKNTIITDQGSSQSDIIPSSNIPNFNLLEVDDSGTVSSIQTHPPSPLFDTGPVSTLPPATDAELTGFKWVDVPFEGKTFYNQQLQFATNNIIPSDGIQCSSGRTKCAENSKNIYYIKEKENETATTPVQSILSSEQVGVDTSDCLSISNNKRGILCKKGTVSN